MSQHLGLARGQFEGRHVAIGTLFFLLNIKLLANSENADVAKDGIRGKGFVTFTGAVVAKNEVQIVDGMMSLEPTALDFRGCELELIAHSITDIRDPFTRE